MLNSFETLTHAERPTRDDNLLYIVKQNSLSASAIPVTDIYTDIVREYIETRKFGSMAFEDKANYALKNHDHDIYTSSYYVQTNTTQPRLEIGDFNGLTTIYVPKQESNFDTEIEEIKSQFQPKIGEMKFTCISVDNLDPASSNNFDGWVYADGRTYAASDFEYGTKLLQIYNNPSTGRFQIPLLSNFVKYNLEKTVPASFNLAKQSGRNSVKTHHHSNNINGASMSSDTVNATFKISVCKTDQLGPSSSSTVLGENPLPHYGYEKDGSVHIYVPREATTTEAIDTTVTFNSLSSGMNYDPTDEATTESYPPYCQMPAMIYIGPKK